MPARGGTAAIRPKAQHGGGAMGRDGTAIIPGGAPDWEDERGGTASILNNPLVALVPSIEAAPQSI
eukprot:10501884-Prorocentrum_lima.AAC.1